MLGLIGQAIPAPEIAVDPVSYDFGTILQNDTLTTFTLSNNGGSDLNWGLGLLEDLSRSSQSITYDQLRQCMHLS